jgi:predicted nucleotidyltransferase
MTFKEKVLFKTLIGSTMWGMDHPGSDRDVVAVYQQSTESILSGYRLETGKVREILVEDGIETDYQYTEIGYLINLILKGNINAIWAVTSPVVVQDSNILYLLRDITVNNLSKRIYASIKGTAIGQMNDEFKLPHLVDKKFRISLRTLNQGITLFETGKLEYQAVGQHITRDEVNTAFKEFAGAYTHTKLPEAPEEGQFRDFLYAIRVAEL